VSEADARERALEQENAALRDRCAELAAKAHYLDVVNYFAASLLDAQHDVDDILWDVANNAVARLGLEDCVIYLVDERGEFLVQRAAYGLEEPARPRDPGPDRDPTRRLGGTCGVFCGAMGPTVGLRPPVGPAHAAMICASRVLREHRLGGRMLARTSSRVRRASSQAESRARYAGSPGRSVALRKRCAALMSVAEHTGARQDASEALRLTSLEDSSKPAQNVGRLTTAYAHAASGRGRRPTTGR